MATRTRINGGAPATVMTVLGGACVVLGGLVAAVTGPLELDHGSWLAAYLVLVCGVAQFAIGTVQTRTNSPDGPIAAALGWSQLICFNVGNAAVVVGTLTREPLLVDGATLLLLFSLGVALFAARPGARKTIKFVAGLPTTVSSGRLLLWTYRVLLVLLILSLPIGAVLAHVREP